ncbi:hypothetical protein PTKIN_Ptkin01aG0375200 [Pterospermum kingtungense]
MKNEQSSEALSYDDFEPYCKWKHETSASVLEIYLAGFKQEELKCEKKCGFLYISGEHRTGKSLTKRFTKKIDISNYVIKEIEAKFEGGQLKVKLPRKGSAFSLFTIKNDKQENAIVVRLGNTLYMQTISFAIRLALLLLAFYVCKNNECIRNWFN